MSLAQDLIALAQKLEEIESQLGDVPAALEAAKEEGRRSRDQEFIDMQASKDEEKRVFGESEYQRGFVDGGNGAPPASDKIYSQAEVDAMLAPLNESVIAMQGRISELEAIVAGVDSRIAEAVASKIAEFKAGLDEVEAKF